MTPHTSTSTAERVRENRLRLTAQRRGFILTKSRRRDARAYDFGVFWVSDLNHNLRTAEVGISLDEVEEFLNG